MRELIRQASEIAARHRSALMPAIVAEQMLLSLGFDSVRFGAKGCEAARFLGIWYPLTEDEVHAAR